jgi:transposase
MAGIYKLEIQESEEALKELLRTQKTASGKERIHLLYLLKSKQAVTVQEAAAILGRHRATLQEWLRLYRQGGVDELLKRKSLLGRPRAIPQWAERALQKRLEEPQGFDGYQAIATGWRVSWELRQSTKRCISWYIIAYSPPRKCPDLSVLSSQVSYEKHIKKLSSELGNVGLG